MDEVERIAREVLRRLGEEKSDRAAASGIPVTVSARHVHIARGNLDRLFGDGAALTKLRDLGQPGEFAAEQRVTLVGRSGRALEGVRILGPLRQYTQVELSRTFGRGMIVFVVPLTILTLGIGVYRASRREISLRP